MYYISVRVTLITKVVNDVTEMQGTFQPLGIFTEKTRAEETCVQDKEKMPHPPPDGVGYVWDISEIESLNVPVKL